MIYAPAAVRDHEKETAGIMAVSTSNQALSSPYGNVL